MLSRNNSLALKGIAILIIMLGHLVNFNKSNLPYDLRFFAAFSVSIFLILSGYGLTLSSKVHGLHDFFRKRLISVILPYALATICVSIWLGQIINSPVEVIKNITLTEPSNPIDPTMWFIYYIVFWYIIFFIIHILFKNALIRIAIFLCISYVIKNYQLIPQFELLQFPFQLHAFSFTVGVIIGEINQHLKNRGKLHVSILAISLLLFVYFSKSLFYSFSLDAYFWSCLFLE